MFAYNSVTGNCDHSIPENGVQTCSGKFATFDSSLAFDTTINKLVPKYSLIHFSHS